MASRVLPSGALTVHQHFPSTYRAGPAGQWEAPEGTRVSGATSRVPDSQTDPQNPT